MGEAQLQASVMKWLRSIPRSWWVKPTVTNLAGCPDILGYVQGFGVAIEMKVKPNKATPKQEYEIERINNTGCVAFVAYGKEDILEKLNMLCVELE